MRNAISRGIFGRVREYTGRFIDDKEVVVFEDECDENVGPRIEQDWLSEGEVDIDSVTSFDECRWFAWGLIEEDRLFLNESGNHSSRGGNCLGSGLLCDEFRENLENNRIQTEAGFVGANRVFEGEGKR